MNRVHSLNFDEVLNRPFFSYILGARISLVLTLADFSIFWKMPEKFSTILEILFGKLIRFPCGFTSNLNG